MTEIPAEIQKLARGEYQRAILYGDEAVNGSTLRGRAKQWSGRYASSAQTVLARLDAAGVKYWLRGGFVRLGERDGCVVCAQPATQLVWDRDYCGTCAPSWNVAGCPRVVKLVGPDRLATRDGSHAFTLQAPSAVAAWLRFCAAPSEEAYMRLAAEAREVVNGVEPADGRRLTPTKFAEPQTGCPDHWAAVFAWRPRVTP